MSPTESANYNIHVHQYEGPFRNLPNSIWENPNISWAAKGLLGYLLSRSKTWKLHTWQLSRFYEGKKKGGGEKAVLSLIKELKNAGYITYSKSQDSQGFWVHRYDVYSEPVEKNIQKNIPEPSYPHVDHPRVDNGGIIPINELPNIELEKDIYKPRAREKKTDDRKLYGKFVRLKEESYNKLVQEHGFNTVKDVIECIDDYCTNNRPKGYLDYEAAFRTFIKRDKKNPKSSAFPFKGRASDKGAINQRPDDIPTGWYSSGAT